ncbi:hypothetical protein B0H15DRAFT_926766 [Mycena belliarum]|uniref:Uncharacterized protein n=1 Tax=Mycena belliarum TaxID=1033014 RepID=A0AAD6UIT1_9AGAR|nr:hypothetical protein B0H15DRAFT_926766 [Mycena belliae]
MSLVALFVLLSALPWLVTSTFSFNSTTPTECDNISVSWTGGAGNGYYLSIIPVYDVPRNISIPSTSFSDGKGTFSTQLPFKAGTQLVLTMSDSTRFGAGGTTVKMTVGKSLGGSCNTTTPALAFTFTMPNSLQQCQPYFFTNYIPTGAFAPVSIMGVIPGGDSFELHPPETAMSYQWTADVYNGTDVIFLMVDARLRSGGSALYTVAPSSDSSCINSKSPTVTVSPSSPSTTSSESSIPSTPRSVTGAIAGSVMGALIFLAVLITMGLFFLRQRQEKKKAALAGGSEFRRSRPMDSELDLNYSNRNVSNTHPYEDVSTPNSSVAMFSGGNPPPSLQGVTQPPAHYQAHSGYLGTNLPESANPFNAASSATHTNNPDIDPFMERGTSDTITTGQRKSGMSGFTGYTPSRYVVHTDAEDDDLPVNEHGVVELPPQYSATRGARSAQQSKSSHSS